MIMNFSLFFFFKGFVKFTTRFVFCTFNGGDYGKLVANVTYEEFVCSLLFSRG